MTSKRFRVAFTFAGEKREFVAEVASILATRLGEASILYDKYHEAEFARRDLSFYLPDLYHNNSDLIIVIISADYEQGEWCGLEWAATFDLIKQRRDDSVMLCRFNQARVRGLFSSAGFVELDDKTPNEAAVLILQRLAVNEGLPKNSLVDTLAFDPARPGPNIIPAPTRKKKRRLPALAAGLGLLLIAVVALVGRQLSRNNIPSPDNQANSSTAIKNVPAPAPARTVLTYSLTVQKVFDGKEVGGPTQYTGAELFGNGWRFRFNITTAEDGHFYLLNVAPQPDGSDEWNVLFPTPRNNAGQSKMKGQQKQSFGWYIFDDKPGPEKLWIIWSHQPVSELENAVKAAVKTKLVIKEPHLAAVSDFLHPFEGQLPTAIQDEQQKQTIIQSDAPTWAYLVNLRHDKY